MVVHKIMSRIYFQVLALSASILSFILIAESQLTDYCGIVSQQEIQILVTSMEQTGLEASSYETYALEKFRLPGDYGDTIQILLLVVWVFF